MKRSLLLGYQWLIGLSDTGTGVMLCLAPTLTLRLMGVQAPEDASAYVGYIGAFVFSIGLTCLYGAYLLAGKRSVVRLETIWLVTALARGAVAVYVFKCILTGAFEPAWLSVAVFDAACVAIQAIGLRRRWLCDAHA